MIRDIVMGGGGTTTASSTHLDLSTATFSSSGNGWANVSGADTSPQGIRFNSDGTRLYFAGGTGQYVFMYSVPTAYSINNLVHLGAFSTDTKTDTIEDLAFSADGTKMYVLCSNFDQVYQYDLEIAWDIGSSVYNTKHFILIPEDTSPRGFTFSANGTKMYVLGQVNSKVFQYTLSTAWDITTASYSSISLDTSAYSFIYAITFNSIGTKMYLTSSGSDSVVYYTLSTAWNVSTASLSSNTILHNTVQSAPTGIALNPTGSKLYITDSDTKEIREYSLSTAYDPSSMLLPISYPIVYLSGTPNVAQGLFFKPDGSTLYIVSSTTDSVMQYSLPNAWEIARATYVQSFSIVGKETTSTGLFFKTDGLKMYIIGTTSDSVHEYTLSTAWDISTSVFSATFSVGSKDTVPTGLFFTPDGLKMYIIGTNTDYIYTYTLSTAWDISTSVFYETSRYLGNEDTTPQGITFGSSGMDIFSVGSGSDTIRQYPQSSAWSTGTVGGTKQAFSVSNQTTLPYDIRLSSDDSKMYVVGSNGILIKYNLGV